MRQADRNELAASSGEPVQQIIDESILASTLCWTALIDGEVAAIFGCAPIGTMLSLSGAPWMLGTDVLDRHPLTLMKTCRPYTVQMQKTFNHLRNYVDARNVKSIRWLRRLGFTIHPAAPYGVAGQPFHLFEMG